MLPGSAIPCAPLLQLTRLLLVTPPPSEKKPPRNKQLTLSASDKLQGAVGAGAGAYLSLVDSAAGESRAGTIYCTPCGAWLASKGAILKDRCLGKNKVQPDGRYVRQPGWHAQKVAAAAAAPPVEVCEVVHTHSSLRQQLLPPSPHQPRLVLLLLTGVTRRVCEPRSCPECFWVGVGVCIRMWVWGQACLCKPSMGRSISFSGKLKILTTCGAAACRSMPQQAARTWGDRGCLDPRFNSSLTSFMGLPNSGCHYWLPHLCCAPCAHPIPRGNTPDYGALSFKNRTPTQCLVQTPSFAIFHCLSLPSFGSTNFLSLFHSAVLKDGEVGKHGHISHHWTLRCCVSPIPPPNSPPEGAQVHFLILSFTA